MQNHFSGKATLSLKLYKDFLSVLKFPINLFWSLPEASIESWVQLSVSKRFKNAKFARRIQNHFSEKVKQTLKISENFLRILEFPVNLFWSLSKTKIESFDKLNIGSRLYNAKFARPTQILKLSKNVPHIIEFSINKFWSQSKTLLKSSEWLNIGSSLYNAKLGWRIQNHFSRKERQIMKLSKNLLSSLEFSICLEIC